MSRQNRSLVESHKLLNEEMDAMRRKIGEMQTKEKLDADKITSYTSKYRHVSAKLEVAEKQLEQEKKKNEGLSKSTETIRAFFEKFKEAVVDVANTFEK
jgi:hypothetical protein